MNTEQGNNNLDISNQNIHLSSIHQSRIDSKYLITENKIIKKQNQKLKKQFQLISFKLDGEIKKRLDDHKKKPWLKTPEDVSHMQLQNAYKKCQIYKKQIFFYRKKLDNVVDTERVQLYQQKIQEYMRQVIQLKDEIKSLKKINKFQQKGLEQLGVQGYLKTVLENQKLQEQVRRLKKQLEQYRRNIRSKTETDAYQTVKQKPQPTIRDKEIENELSIKGKLKSQQGNYDEQSINLLHIKMEKDYQKITNLNSEKNKLKALIETYQNKLKQKDKQIFSLKEKIGDLRKNNKVLLSRSQVKVQKSPQKKQKGRQSSSNLNYSSQKRRIWNGNNSNQQQLSKRYPKRVQKGQSINNAIKWSHESFSSKIKEIHVILHQNGHIESLHARYEKGQPKKYNANSKKIYKILSCNNQQYITSLKGSFIDGYLQYLSIQTNSKRNERFGNEVKESEKGEHQDIFAFQSKEGQYLGALYGQNDDNGILKLGCFILKE